MSENNLINSAIVLVVDDSPDSLGMLNMALDEAGYTSLVALNGKQALSILEKVQPDIILMDAIMPEKDGFETCTEVKQLLPNVPVIFMTGLTETENVVKGLEAGGVDYITKPIKPEEVLARIKVHLANARLSDSARAALDITGQNLFAIDDKGILLWSTPHIRDLLSSIPNSNNLLREQLLSALNIWLENEGSDKKIELTGYDKRYALSYVSKHKDGEHIIRLEEEIGIESSEILAKDLPVTKRESEVLLWISQGKTNWEIAQILDISPRTVNKHLEQIFKKIGVDNRTAAAAIALNLLKDK